MSQDTRENLVYCLNRRQHVLIWGPARDQKRTLVRNITQTLGLRFRDVTLCPVTMEEDLMGGLTPNGAYVSGPFQEVFQHGGSSTLMTLRRVRQDSQLGLQLSLIIPAVPAVSRIEQSSVIRISCA
jgi:hypothetical protein